MDKISTYLRQLVFVLLSVFYSNDHLEVTKSNKDADLMVLSHLCSSLVLLSLEMIWIRDESNLYKDLKFSE